MSSSGKMYSTSNSFRRIKRRKPQNVLHKQPTICIILAEISLNLQKNVSHPQQILPDSHTELRIMEAIPKQTV